MTRAQTVDSFAGPKVPPTWLAEVYERSTRQEPNLSQMIGPNRRLLQIGDDLGEAYEPEVETTPRLSGETPALQGATREHIEHIRLRNNVVHTGCIADLGAMWGFTAGFYQLHYEQSWVADALGALREIDEEGTHSRNALTLASYSLQFVETKHLRFRLNSGQERGGGPAAQTYASDAPTGIEVTGEADDLARSLGVRKDANIVLRLAQRFVPEAEHAKMTVTCDFEDGTKALHVTVRTSAPPDEVVSAEDRLHEALFDHLTPVSRSCFSIDYDFVTRRWTR